MKKRDYSKNSEESEKAIEAYLCRLMREAGGIALKYYNPSAAGYPDRILLYPDGTTAWVEVKSAGRHPTPLQARRMARLREDFRQRVFLCDSREKARAIVARTHPSFDSPRVRMERSRKQADEERREEAEA